MRDSGGRTNPLADPTVVAVHVSKRFGETDVVQGLTFEVERGQIFGIIGPSGSGKTTMMRMLLGVLRPTTGDLRVLGRRPHQFRRRERERLGYMPQLFVLFPELSVSENLNFAASVYGVGWFGRGKRIRQALEFVELWDARNRPASKLSGGMQRRLELAATLLHNPEVVFLDEPTAGIDPVLRAKFWDHFRELRDQGRTLIITTQYVTESEYCDRILALKDGGLVALGTPEDVRRRAMGGEVVHVSGSDLGRQAVALMREVPGVRGVRRLEHDRLELVVEDAGSLVPVLLETLRVAGVEVDEVAEQHPSFDEVFVRLMEADDARAPNGHR
ncbi:MAG: ABC transporter ATP-binding protein [Chloroflexota bacterium]|nr:ABC transporter ATP-binding protein [Chloroflexota bacterium]